MKRCPRNFLKPVDGLLPSLVRDGAFHRIVKNLGWLIRNWTLIDHFDLYPHPPVEKHLLIGDKVVNHRPLQPDLYLVARLRDGRTYETGYSCYTVFQDWISRSHTLRDVQINIHPQLAKQLKK